MYIFIIYLYHDVGVQTKAACDFNVLVTLVSLTSPAVRRSGGAMINDTFVHLANPHLPFGGCGESGFGSYHGKWGFEEFSHKRSVLARPLFLDIDPWINTPTW